MHLAKFCKLFLNLRLRPQRKKHFFYLNYPTFRGSIVFVIWKPQIAFGEQKMTKQSVSLLAIVLVMLAASPSAAIVVLNCADLGNGVVELSYDSTQEASRVRAFGLDIRVSAGIITSIGNLNPDYYIYPGSIIIDEYGEVVDWGTPVACGWAEKGNNDKKLSAANYGDCAPTKRITQCHN
jgi:hypothetical protein